MSQVKLIAEPWDLGEGGYQVGNFPALWTEWNGKFRDTVRDYWRGEYATMGEFASRFTGSSDLYLDDGRSPHASINFVVAHDGFTLRDLVSYNEKHNEANGEENRDGESHNRSWNCGAEGETDIAEVNELRARQQRNFLTTLVLSQGVPMIAHGDELGRTQGGNNNGYCQDNEITWMDWAGADRDLIDFTRKLIAIRRDHPIFRRQKFFNGQPIETEDWDAVPDITWLKPDGEAMTPDDWQVGYAKTITVVLNGHALDEKDYFGRKLYDASFIILFNASEQDEDCVDPRAQGRHHLGRGSRHRCVARTGNWRGPGTARRRRRPNRACQIRRCAARRRWPWGAGGSLVPVGVRQRPGIGGRSRSRVAQLPGGGRAAHGLSRGLGRWQARTAHVRDADALGVREPRARVMCEVDPQRICGTEAGALPDPHDGQVRAEGFADLVADGHPTAVHQHDRRQPPAEPGQLLNGVRHHRRSVARQGLPGQAIGQTHHRIEGPLRWPQVTQPQHVGAAQPTAEVGTQQISGTVGDRAVHGNPGDTAGVELGGNLRPGRFVPDGVARVGVGGAQRQHFGDR